MSNALQREFFKKSTAQWIFISSNCVRNGQTSNRENYLWAPAPSELRNASGCEDYLQLWGWVTFNYVWEESERGRKDTNIKLICSFTLGTIQKGSRLNEKHILIRCSTCWYDRGINFSSIHLKQQFCGQKSTRKLISYLGTWAYTPKPFAKPPPRWF